MIKLPVNIVGRRGETPLPGATISAPGKDLTFLPASGDRLRFREDIGPDADQVPLHRHLRQTERFTVLSGALTLSVAGQVIRLGEGECLEVAPGVLHTYAPAATEAGAAAGATLIEVEIWPARRAHLFFETIYGFAREGRLPPRSLRDGLALMALAHAHSFVLGRWPIWAMRAIAGVCASIAALFRIEPWSPRFAGRLPDAPPPMLYLLASQPSFD